MHPRRSDFLLATHQSKTISVSVGWNQAWTEKANSAFRVYTRGMVRTVSVVENPRK